jgi:undecaprenyl-diphosphatase
VTYAQAVVLGLVQGLTEFLPISSSGHLILVPRVFGWPDQGLAVDAALHLGTLAALVAYFRGELIGLLAGTVSRRLGVLVVLATIPAGVAALLFGPLIERTLRWPMLIAFTTAFWGVIMLLADRRASPAPRAQEVAGPDDPLERVGWRQGLAVLDRATAARYSFLLGIPITAAAGLKKAAELANGGLAASQGGPLLVAIAVSFVSGWFAVWFLVNYLKRRSLTPFVVYRLALAALIVAVWYR